MKAENEGLYRDWIVYILQCSDGTFYTGVTNNLGKRLRDHSHGTASKYTRSRRPVQLLSAAFGMDKREALCLEIKIKKMRRKEKICFLKSSFLNVKTSL